MLNRPWQRGGPIRLSLGVMTPRRKLASSAYYPGPQARIPLAGGKIPYWYVVDYTLAGRDSGDGRIVVGKHFVLVALMGSASQGAGSFRTQFFHVLGTQKGFRFSRTGLNFGNALGAATDAFFLRRPYPMPNETELLNRTANLNAAQNVVQIVAYGFQD
ncbi:MAG: hypothetical protein L0212_04160 [Acidobacteria bacterium]|nr:hypothetical protein [Acidobacteriota bacterium]